MCDPCFYSLAASPGRVSLREACDAVQYVQYAAISDVIHPCF